MYRSSSSTALGISPGAEHGERPCHLEQRLMA